jgi:hypothetical protein
MVGRSGEDWVVVADAPEEKFVYGYKIDPSGSLQDIAELMGKSWM